jgi:hypothetical protein
VNPLTSASMAAAVDVAREASSEAPLILWPADWPAPELVAWTLAQMLAETVPAAAGTGRRPSQAPAPTLALE